MRSHSLRKSVSAKTNSADSTVPRSPKSADAPKTALVQQIGATNSESAGINQLKPAKRTRNRIPLAQRERILQESVAGKSITQIARKENRNRETVARIVKGDEIRGSFSA
jgi:DNA-binding CsgD family transcriptional regulator